MKFPVLTHKQPRQKALSFEDYIEFIGCFIEKTSLERARSQKKREENIKIPFSFRNPEREC